MHNTFKSAILLVLMCAVFLSAQEKNEITVEWIYSDASADLTAIHRSVWLDNNTLLLYDQRKPEDKRTFEIYDPQSGKTSDAVNAVQAVANLSTLLQNTDNDHLTWPLAFNTQCTLALYLIQNDIFLLDLKKAAFSRITKTDAIEKCVRFSPNGKMISFVRDNDLFIFDIKNNKESPITNDGSETTLNGTLSWVYWEEIFGRNDLGYWWSEDSKNIAYFQTDESPVAITHFVDFKPAVPNVIKQRYPKAGMANPVVRLGIADIKSAKTTWADFGDFNYEYLVRVKWLPQSDRVSVQTLNRAQDELRLFFVDRQTGKSTFILKETDEGWVNMHDDLIFIDDGQHFIWQSERDGFAHLYKFKMNGELVNQVTRGEWAVKSADAQPRKTIAAVDDKNDWIYFSSLEKSSVERHLYRIHSDGSGMQRLTKGDGTYSINFSPNGKYFTAEFSNISTPPIFSLYKNDGSKIKELFKSRTDLAKALDFQYPELFEIPAKDGFLMPAEILKPNNFDPSKKYPVIMNIYGGPSAPTVSNSWGRGRRYFDQILSKRGYIVVRFDHRAAAGISKKYENLLLKKFISEVELADIVDGLKWLKEQPWVDDDRFGMWGWSGGGSFTLHTMTRTKEIKAGIAVAAVTDWHFYDTRWAEFAMKTPQVNPDGYENTSILRHAKNLHGRLLLVHGTYDDNVHPQNAWSFIEELVQANIPFDMMFYPMRKHGIVDRAARIHLFNKMLEFWADNL
jgi:dipeptidyl-peptidase 4